MPRTWIASYYQTASLSARDEQEAEEGREEATKLVADANAEVAFAHYGLKSKFAQSVRPGDYIIWLSRPRSASERLVFVYRGSRVLPVKSGTHHRFLYYESSPKVPVDKFQGEQAPIVIFSMTSSTGDESPRGVDFLFEGSRINVALSRRRCWPSS